MSDSHQIIAVLEAFGKAYPRQTISKQTAELYVQFLAEIPIGLLWQVAERHIATSSYFPRIAELRTLATRLAGTSKFSSPAPTASPDTLAYQVQALEDALYEDQTLDPQAWLALADQFERADRPHRALHTRQKLAAFQSILEKESELASLPSPEIGEAAGGDGRLPFPIIGRGEGSASLRRGEV